MSVNKCAFPFAAVVVLFFSFRISIQAIAYSYNTQTEKNRHGGKHFWHLVLQTYFSNLDRPTAYICACAHSTAHRHEFDVCVCVIRHLHERLTSIWANSLGRRTYIFPHATCVSRPVIKIWKNWPSVWYPFLKSHSGHLLAYGGLTWLGGSRICLMARQLKLFCRFAVAKKRKNRKERDAINNGNRSTIFHFCVSSSFLAQSVPRAFAELFILFLGESNSITQTSFIFRSPLAIISSFYRLPLSLLQSNH